jgi:23S rRNA pseudouridine2457 synthase
MDELVYVAFYKPYGVLTAFTDEEGRETLKGYIELPDIYPVGRLDMDSEGLLLLTNDGGLAHRLTEPRFNHPKTYLVQVEGVPTAEALAKLASGVEVKGEKTRRCEAMVVPEPGLPARAKPVTPHGPTTWLRIVLREGKKRQIRHMTAAVGLPTLRLVRVAIGPLALKELQPGQWRSLLPAEVDALKGLAARTAAKAERKPAASAGNTPGSRYRSAGRRSPGR